MKEAAPRANRAAVMVVNHLGDEVMKSASCVNDARSWSDSDGVRKHGTRKDHEGAG